ncbi:MULTISPECIES: aldehyde dehydrogenase family protein [unclassified Spirosoma]|uniref:aldehyde dehydrogenase family protein n=1 Tax=unclassified Spirosoma TaxID=2621999 RepID=UPI00095A70F4|nr:MULTISPECIES: aldehyde dehydrogenase family protein [unclassified Spirosoma]MBN8821542.1 aldehyde dehydrogenase family protein [Spirosoma sp.]OJW78318.1 MAG: aldehyde dehydrogenase family protein [Spirosoma sp. 48-14]
MITPAPKIDVYATIRSAFDAQRRHAPQQALTTVEQRRERLLRIQSWITVHEKAIQQAMYTDFRKPSAEAMLGDLIPLHAEIRFAIRHLNQWMKPQPLPTPLPLIGTRSYIHHEAKGNILIISPWNYPVSLSLRPLVLALAAGNVVILKPSELTPHTSALLKQMISELFPPEEVFVIEGDATVSQALLELPFNHIFFTGSPAVGRVVMAAAAKHLASVTLELGGKSPAIVDESANLTQAAEQLAWGKCLNAGQTCISPDYVLVHESVKAPFVNLLKERLQKMYSPDGQPIESSTSYARIINNRHFQRLKQTLDDALSKGATVTFGGKANSAQNFMEPTVLENVTDAMQVMQEEIFGPILPVISFNNLDEALQTINRREKPLALYIHSRNRSHTRYILDHTSAGDTVVNDTMLQFSTIDLPFGGVNHSGIGKSNGIHGFQEFSNQRGVMYRDFGTMKFVYPPYTDSVKKLINYIVKLL